MNSAPRTTSPGLLARALALASVVGCVPDDGPPGVSRVDPPRLYACPTCPGADDAPLPDGAGIQRCVRVGASTERTPDDPRALLPGLPEPIRYVDPAAPAGGDGTRARPFTTLALGLAATPSGTLVLSAGRHAVASTLTPRGAVALVGAGAAQTTVEATVTGALLIEGGAADVTVARLTLASPMGATGFAVEVREGARATLRDVVLLRPYVGLRAQGASTRLIARGVTVEASVDDGVRVDDGAIATLRGALLRGCGRHGLRAGTERTAEGGRVHMSESLVEAARGYGVALAGDGGATTGFGDCAAEDPLASRGGNDCLREVSVQRVTGVGLGVTGARAVFARRLQVSCTRADTGADVGSGYGVYATLGAELHFDDEAGFTGAGALGRGSQLIANARAGMVIERQREGGASAPRDTVLTLRGAFVASNEGPGILLQNGARATEIGYAQVIDNAGLGLGLTEGTRVAEVLCDQFISTRFATLGVGANARTVADGLSMYAASAGRVDDNQLSRNARFGAVLSGATARLTRNHGEANLYGIGNYGARDVVIDASNRVSGTAPPPPAAPVVERTR